MHLQRIIYISCKNMTREILSDQELGVSALLPEDLERALSAYLSDENRGGITLSLPNVPNVAVPRRTLVAIKERLTDRMLQDRINKLTAEGEHDPLAYIVGGQLVRANILPRPKVRAASFRLMKFLTDNIPEAEDNEITETIPQDILREEQLNEAMELATPFAAARGSIASQLREPFSLAARGLIIAPSRQKEDPEEKGFKLPQQLLSILKALKYPESADILQKWIYDHIVDPGPCVNLLEVLAQFTAFLDSESLIQIYAPSTNGDTKSPAEIPLLPFQSFHAAVIKAREYLTELQVGDEYLGPLKKVEDTILMRFQSMLRGPVGGKLSVIASEAFQPSVGELVQRTQDWYWTRGKRLPATRVAATYTLKTLEQLGVSDSDDVELYLRTLSEREGVPLSFIQQLRREAIRLNLLADPDGRIISELMVDTLQAMERNPMKDASKIDFTNVIRPEIDTLEITYMPGTLVFHQGHLDLLQRLVERDYYLGDRDENGKIIQRIILMVPLTNIESLTNYHKDPAVSGTVTERAGSILLQTAHLPRRNIFMTSKLQPHPRETGQTTQARINATVHNLHSKINQDFRNAGGAVWFDIEDRLAVGVDEFNWTEVKQVGVQCRTLAHQQPGKMAKPSIAVGRYGYLVDTLEAGDAILSQTNVQELILTPGTHKTSSTEAIRRMAYGDPSYFLATAVPFMQNHWSRPAIEARKRVKKSGKMLEGDTPPSINEIARATTDEYRQLLKDLGVI